MSELIDRLLKSSKHEEQSYNACAGILHKVKTIPKGAAEEVARKCIEINSCKYFTFKQMLKKMDVKELPSIHQEHCPTMKISEERTTISKGDVLWHTD